MVFGYLSFSMSVRVCMHACACVCVCVCVHIIFLCENALWGRDFLRVKFYPLGSYSLFCFCV